VLNTKKALEARGAEELTSLVDNQIAKENILRLVASLGFTADTEEDDGLFYIHIKSDTAAASRVFVEQKAPHKVSTGGNLLLLTSDDFGQQDSNLGEVLMRTFLYTVSHTPKQQPEYIVLIGRGVLLTATSSLVLHHLQQLVAQGCQVLICGICLEYYALHTNYHVGRVSNMLEIWELLATCNVIRI